MTLDEQLQAAMLISGNFEGSDPWANITGNIDEEGLTCGQLGKTVKSGDLQEVMQMYLADNTTDSVLSLMPQTGNEYLRMIKLPAQQALNVVIPWSNGRSRVRDPYGSELAAFWKCAGMVACQKAHAATHEGKNVPLWLADWTGGAEGSFHAYALLFDIATQGGSMRGVDRARVNAFLAQGMDAAMASIISWCRGVDKGLSGAVDARRNADLWEAMLMR